MCSELCISVCDALDAVVFSATNLRSLSSGVAVRNSAVGPEMAILAVTHGFADGICHSWSVCPVFYSPYYVVVAFFAVIDPGSLYRRNFSPDLGLKPSTPVSPHRPVVCSFFDSSCVEPMSIPLHCFVPSCCQLVFSPMQNNQLVQTERLVKTFIV